MLSPYLNVDAKGWQNKAIDTVCVGGSVSFGPWPRTGGSWSWTGPNGFTSATRSPLIDPIAANQFGIYKATHTDANGCMASQNFNIIKCSTITSVFEKEDVAELEVYPNPSTGTISIRFKDENAHQVILLDLVGKEVYRTTITNGETLETNLPIGVYLLKIANESGQQFKVVIE